jgi:hypothetical protein
MINVELDDAVEWLNEGILRHERNGCSALGPDDIADRNLHLPSAAEEIHQNPNPVAWRLAGIKPEQAAQRSRLNPKVLIGAKDR